MTQGPATLLGFRFSSSASPCCKSSPFKACRSFLSMEIQSVLPPPPRYPITQTTTSPNGQTNTQTVMEMSNVLTHPSGPEFQLSVGEGQNLPGYLPLVPNALSYTMHQAHTSSKTTCTSQRPHLILKMPPSSILTRSLQHLHRQRQASNSRFVLQALQNRRHSSTE